MNKLLLPLLLCFSFLAAAQETDRLASTVLLKNSLRLNAYCSTILAQDTAAHQALKLELLDYLGDTTKQYVLYRNREGQSKYFVPTERQLVAIYLLSVLHRGNDTFADELSIYDYRNKQELRSNTAAFELLVEEMKAWAKGEQKQFPLEEGELYWGLDSCPCRNLRDIQAKEDYHLDSLILLKEYNWLYTLAACDTAAHKALKLQLLQHLGDTARQISFLHYENSKDKSFVELNTITVRKKIERRLAAMYILSALHYRTNRFSRQFCIYDDKNKRELKPSDPAFELLVEEMKTWAKGEQKQFPLEKGGFSWGLPEMNSEKVLKALRGGKGRE